MTWDEALSIVIAETGVERYRWLTSEDNPDVAAREGYRRFVLERAGEKPSRYPGLFTMAGNALTAAARFVASGLAMVDDAEQERRLSICRGCEKFVAEDMRCRACGCGLNLKARVRSSSCPLGKW